MDRTGFTTLCKTNRVTCSLHKNKWLKYLYLTLWNLILKAGERSCWVYRFVVFFEFFRCAYCSSKATFYKKNFSCSWKNLQQEHFHFIFKLLQFNISSFAAWIHTCWLHRESKKQEVDSKENCIESKSDEFCNEIATRERERELSLLTYYTP